MLLLAVVDFIYEIELRDNNIIVRYKGIYWYDDTEKIILYKNYFYWVFFNVMSVILIFLFSCICGYYLSVFTDTLPKVQNVYLTIMCSHLVQVICSGIGPAHHLPMT